MRVTIRRGAEGDLPFLREQLLAIHKLHRSAYPEVYRDIGPHEAEAFLSERLEDERCFVRVAETSRNEIAGHTLSEIQERPGTLFTHPLKIVYLAQIVVTSEYRNRGIGRRLVEDVLAIARARGIHRVELNVWEFDGNARRFFARSGFRDFGYRMVQRAGEERG